MHKHGAPGDGTSEGQTSGATLKSALKLNLGRQTSDVAGSDASDGIPNIPIVYHEAEVVNVEEFGGRHRIHTPRVDSKSDLHTGPRLLIVSNKVKNSSLMQVATWPNVIFVQYKYDGASLESILSHISQSLGGKKVESIAFVLHGSSSSIQISGKDEQSLTKDGLADNHTVQDFFRSLTSTHLDCACVGARLDFLGFSAAQNNEGAQIAAELQNVIGVPVNISKDLIGSDILMERNGEDPKHVTVGELYFRFEKLRNTSNQSLAGFEKIRTVGKGAYGTAVLYKKKDDDSLVILKEINLHDLTAAERQMALNEVKVLSVLDHPNIISYYDSFEEDGIVMIEMEYADGGTLAQHLGSQEKPLDEKEILGLFHQMVAALKYIHEHNILHRDLKTANIFLTKEGVVKVGDFGISKMMSTTNPGANTVLGTPYYISPEMCEGKPYNDKSDIWALGCILYEMACLQKTFEGSNLPALVNKIMKGQFAPVKGNYSSEFRLLIRDMLQREPEYRPSSRELWCQRLPELMCRYEDPVTDYEEDLTVSSENKKRKVRSVLYYLEMATMDLSPVPLPSAIKIRDVAVGNDHVIVVTVERMVFTWGEGGKGQLGHGSLESSFKPELVEALKGKSIIRACCGDGFSVFGSDNGIVMTCGDGTKGCLGHGDWCSTSRPRLIEALLSVDVTALACGKSHVVAVGSDGEVFSWGAGEDGQLGLSDEEDVCLPQEVSLPDGVMVRDVRCGRDGTMLLTDVGSVLACGCNEYNKLGLNNRQGFLMAMKNIFAKTEVEGVKAFTVVRSLARHRVVDISMGKTHTSVLVEPGHIYTFGKNGGAQLGTGNTKSQNAPIGVKFFEEQPAIMVRCGDTHTVAGTTNNELIFWGTRYKTPANLAAAGSDSKTPQRERRTDSVSSSRSHSRQPSTSSVASLKESQDAKDSSSGSRQLETNKNADRQVSLDSVFSSSGEKASWASTITSGFRPISSTPRRTPSATSARERDREKESKEDMEVVMNPTPLLRMDYSGSQSDAGDTVTLTKFFCHGENLFVQVETTAPPPRRKSRKKRGFRKRASWQNLEIPQRCPQMSASSRDGDVEYSSEASEMDTCGTIPTWLKQELATSEQDVNEAEDSDQSDVENSQPVTKQDSSIASIQINKDLRHNSKKAQDNKKRPSSASAMRKEKTSDSVGKKERNSTSAPSHQALTQKSSSVESGVEVHAGELFSSSSSSEAMAAAYRHDVRTGPGVPPKKPPLVRKVSVPPPNKSKAGPQQSQKPLSRIRAQGKARAKGSGDGPLEVNPHKLTPGDDIRVDEKDLTSVQAELKRIRDEKRKTEERLRKVEEEHIRQREMVKVQTEKAAAERESELKNEIRNLRQELLVQGSRLQDNYDVVLSLQEQLVKVQSEQMRMSAKEERAKSAQSQRDSRVCSIQ